MKAIRRWLLRRRIRRMLQEVEWWPQDYNDQFADFYVREFGDPRDRD